MSESEEMYLVSLARLQETGAETPIPVTQLAAELSVQPVSASQMIHKLEEAGLFVYTPYKGVALTPEGEQRARRILRLRRLWEVFLVEHLKVTLIEASELACRLEHAIPADVAERLAVFLGNPRVSPLGKPIPQALSSNPLRTDIRLSQLKAGELGQVTQIDSEAAVQAFFSQEGIQSGVEIRIRGIGSNRACLAEVAGRSVFLAEDLANQIWVKRSDPLPAR